MKPFYAAPLPDVRKTVDYLQAAVRTLPEHQLVQELHELGAMYRDATDDLTVRLLYRVWEEERARRIDPCQAFDPQLDAALSRLERATTAEDRDLVTTIGRDIFKLGGVDALQAACHRMMWNRKSADLRRHILERRWVAISPPSAWRAAA